MILQFQTADNKMFMVDTAAEIWAQIDKPALDPASVALERGTLIPQGFGVYALKGRKEGLRTIGAFLVPYQTTVTLYVRANVEIKELTMPVPFNEILYEVLPQDPSLIQREIEADHAEAAARTEKPSGTQESAKPGTVSEDAAGTEQPAS